MINYDDEDKLCKVEGKSVGNEQTAFRANLIPHSVPEISLMMMTMLTMAMMMMSTTTMIMMTLIIMMTMMTMVIITWQRSKQCWQNVWKQGSTFGETKVPLHTWLKSKMIMVITMMNIQ